jgi:Helix-turn-helix
MLGLTQQQLADLMGVTVRQACKYETGRSRVASGRLYQLAQALNVDVSYFFEGTDDPLEMKQSGSGSCRSSRATSLRCGVAGTKRKSSHWRVRSQSPIPKGGGSRLHWWRKGGAHPKHRPPG